MGQLSGDLPILPICNPYLYFQKKMKAMMYSSMLDHSNPSIRDLELLKLSDIHSLVFVFLFKNIYTWFPLQAKPDLLRGFVLSWFFFEKFTTKKVYNSCRLWHL